MQQVQAQTDSRQTARDWIAANVPAGAKIVLESYAPYVDPARYNVVPLGRMIDQPPAWYLSQGIDYVVFSGGMYQRFFDDPLLYAPEAAQYNALFNSLSLVKQFDDNNYEIRIYRPPS